jgi:predicted nucleotidyltransferase
MSCVATGSSFVYKNNVNQSASKLPSLDAVRTTVRAVCEKQPVARVQAFGSIVNGVPHAGSDVDLLVEFLPDAHVGLLEMGALKEDLEERLGCSVDLVSRAAVEKSRNPYRRRSILAAPVTLYAR